MGTKLTLVTVLLGYSLTNGAGAMKRHKYTHFIGTPKPEYPSKWDYNSQEKYDKAKKQWRRMKGLWEYANLIKPAREKSKKDR